MAIVYFRFGASPTQEPVRARLLEQLLARARPAPRIEDWRAHALALLAPGEPVPSVAAVLRRAALDPLPSQGLLFVATPVHLVAGLHGVSLAANGMLTLAPEEAARLVAEGNALFGASGVRLARSTDGPLLCALGAPGAPAGARGGDAVAVTVDPARVLGEDVREHLPAGAAGAALRALMSEFEMWLHEHAVNAARRERREAEISGLWLWGGGAADEAAPDLALWSHGEDPLFGRYAPQSTYPRSGRSGVVVHGRAPGEAGWPAFESQWLVPAFEDLRRGRLERLVLSAGSLAFTLSRAAAYRAWRRPKPWWSQLEASARVP